MFFADSDNKTKKYLSDADVQLMLKFKHGDKTSFEVLMKKYFSPLLNFIYKFTNNREVSEDLTQEVFIKVYQNGYKYEPKSSFKTWIYTIAKNLSLNELRRNKYNIVSIDENLDVGGNNVSKQIEDKTVSHPDSDLLKSERIAKIRAVIADLPKNQRIAVILRRYEGFSYQEIAKTMNLSEKAVKSLLSRVKENLKNKLYHFIKNDN